MAEPEVVSYGGLTTVTKYHLQRKDEHVVDSGAWSLKRGGVGCPGWLGARGGWHTGAAASSTAATHPAACLLHLPPSIPAVFMHDNFRPGNRTDESSMVVVTKTHVYAVDGDDSDEEQ